MLKSEAQPQRQRMLKIFELRNHPLVIAALALLAVVLIAASAWRLHLEYAPVPVGGQYNWELRGHSDFHNGAYYPANVS